MKEKTITKIKFRGEKVIIYLDDGNTASSDGKDFLLLIDKYGLFEKVINEGIRGVVLTIEGNNIIDVRK